MFSIGEEKGDFPNMSKPRQVATSCLHHACNTQTQSGHDINFVTKENKKYLVVDLIPCMEAHLVQNGGGDRVGKSVAANDSVRLTHMGGMVG